MPLRMLVLLVDYIKKSAELLTSGDPKKWLAWLIGTIAGVIDGIF